MLTYIFETSIFENLQMIFIHNIKYNLELEYNQE